LQCPDSPTSIEELNRFTQEIDDDGAESEFDIGYERPANRGGSSSSVHRSQARDEWPSRGTLADPP
jgi:hypothetical protein